MRSLVRPSQRGGTDPFLLPQQALVTIPCSFFRIMTYQDTRPRRNRHRAFGILAYGETRNAKVNGFFLNPARIGDHYRRAQTQPQKVNISLGAAC